MRNVYVELALITHCDVFLLMANKNNGCINLPKDVRAQLKSLGAKGDTYGDVIKTLIEKKSCQTPESQSEEI